MYLICFGTRPELIKLIPLIQKLKEKNNPFKTLFSGQHESLIKDFYKYIDNPDFVFTNIMEHGQTLNQLSSKIKLSDIFFLSSNDNFSSVINKIIDCVEDMKLFLHTFHHYNYFLIFLQKHHNDIYLFA